MPGALILLSIFLVSKLSLKHFWKLRICQVILWNCYHRQETLPWSNRKQREIKQQNSVCLITLLKWT